MSLTGSANSKGTLQGSAESGFVLRGSLSGLNTIRGYSAYEVAVINGFKGTEEEWLASIKGAPGEPGYTPVKGKDYFDGEDGCSPTVSVTDIAGGKRVSITDNDGTKNFDLMDGEDGSSIQSIERTAGNGAPGTMDTYTVTLTDGHQIQFEIYNGTDGQDGYTPQKNVDYFDGEDGYTPVKGVDYFDGKDGNSILSITRTAGNGASGATDTYTVTLTDGSKTTFRVYNGTDGQDGYSPTVSVTNITGGKRVSITDKTGTKTFDLMDGEDGYTPVKGVDYFDGEKGDPGYTPVKGKDYFDGKDGYTPQKGVDYFDGEPGEPGYTPVKGVDYNDGEPGKDGVSPIISTETIADGHRIRFTDAEGTKTIELKNGKDGEPGEDGYTPQKGIDYFDGAPGQKGATYTPSVDAAGNLSWSNDSGLANPQTVNVKGDSYVLTEADKEDIAQLLFAELNFIDVSEVGM